MTRPAPADAPSGDGLLALAERHLGQPTACGVPAPKDHPHWRGPWDAAEFVSWVVFRLTGALHGCEVSAVPLSMTRATAQTWFDEVAEGRLQAVDRVEANTVAGVVLVRHPPWPGHGGGQVAVSDGCGGTIEALGRSRGIARGRVEGRLWHAFARLPGLAYRQASDSFVPRPMPDLLVWHEEPPRGPRVRAVQRALKGAGIDPGPIDGRYGPHTVAAVTAFQRVKGLVADGVVGPATARALRIDW